MKTLIGAMFWMLIILVLMYHLSSTGGPIKAYEDESRVMKSNVGRKLIINKDTLIIVDYSYFRDSYTLSNGTIIHKTLFNTNKLK